MSARDRRPSQERDDTDDTLRAERAKTDTELYKARAKVEQDADQLLQSERDRADATLRSTRERTDEATMANVREQQLRHDARQSEDRVVADERATADERLYIEREERQRALNALLRLEREATDDRLLVERAKADEAVTTRDDFLGMVSHDLRTLLGGIALNAAVLVRHASEAGQAGEFTLRHAERIQRFTARMNRLVGDLLDVVSLEAGHLALSRLRQDSVQLVRDIEETFQPSFSAKGLTLTTHVAAGSVLAEFDYERILQVLANLLSNALKFTEPGGRVSLTVEPTGDEVRFSVADTGVGLRAERWERIFERFEQAGRRDRRGLGLGLYIAKCIVDAHGGRIWVEANETGGSTFHFTLPAAAVSPP